MVAQADRLALDDEHAPGIERALASRLVLDAQSLEGGRLGGRLEGPANLLRRRHGELKNVPSIADSQRFPERAAVNDLLAFNRAYRQHIDVRQPLELLNWWELRVALQETDHLYQVWDAVRDARCDYYYVTVRRLALKRLRDLVGEEAYYSSNLPPCVPLWRFEQIR